MLEVIAGYAITDRIDGDNMTERKYPEQLDERIGTKEWGEGVDELVDHYISETIDALGMEPENEQLAKVIYNQALDTKVIENRTLGEIIAASILIASRIDDSPQPPAKVSSLCYSSQTGVNKSVSRLSKELDVQIGPVDPRNFATEYCEKLRLQQSTEEKAIDVIEQCQEAGLHSGRSPSAFAAAAVYLACLLEDELKTRLEVADVAGVSPKSITNNYHPQVEHLGYLQEEETED